MLVSHRYKFVLFPDPLNACPWIGPALQPWLDQTVASGNQPGAGLPLFRGMSPQEARLAFDRMGYDFSAYTRIAVIRNPYAKMAQLYYRITTSDPVWRMRHHMGIEPPDFGRWLRSTRADGRGAGYHGSARWRRFGAWSAKAWCGDCITHTVRSSHAADDLMPIFADMGLVPAFGHREVHELGRQRLARLYDHDSVKLICDRYGFDLAICRTAPPVRKVIPIRPGAMTTPHYRSVA